MKCGRLQLWDRRSVKRDSSTIGTVQSERPRRYCQQKMVNPNHEEDSRWAESKFERFQCEQQGASYEHNCINESNYPLNKTEEDKDMYLTVLNLKFPGDCLKSKFIRTSFKYKMPSAENSNAHRMFVKQPVNEIDYNSCTCNESQTEYKLDDYVKNILNGNDTRPPTSLSGLLNQIPIIDHPPAKDILTEKNILEPKESVESVESEDKATAEFPVEDAQTTVKYQSSGKTRSLTISRAQSPESVQVIRVDVICNYSGRSSVSSFTDTKEKAKPAEEKPTKDFIDSMKHRAAYTNKYILTNTFKQLDETIDNGDKVTLLCKTYKLASRSNQVKDNSDFRRNDISTNKIKAKV